MAIKAEKAHVLLLKDGNRPIGVVIRNGHHVFYDIEEMNDEKIGRLFERNEPPIPRNNVLNEVG